jgi:hypothetical protein
MSLELLSSSNLQPPHSINRRNFVIGLCCENRWWTQDTVKKLRKASLLVRVYAEDAKKEEEGDATTRMETKKALAKGKWESIEKNI